MSRFQPILFGAAAGLLMGLGYFLVPALRVGGDLVFLGLLPAMQALQHTFAAGSDPMVGLVFFVPLLLLIPTSAGALVGLLFCVWRMTFGGHKKSPTSGFTESGDSASVPDRTRVAPDR